MYFPSGAPGREERRQEDGWVDQGWVDRPAVLEEGGLGEEQLSTDSSQLEPVRTPAPVALQPSSEQERPRRPWLPSLDTEIQVQYLSLCVSPKHLLLVLFLPELR